MFVCFFFFKQKTAYDMRISDWSSDVCSSDLANLTSLGVSYALFSADLHDIPVTSNGGGCVVTMHAIEPNGGMEERIIDELVRVSRRHIIVMEPDFSQATETQRERMQRLGYTRNIFPTILKREDIEYQLYLSLELHVTHLNPS